MVKIKDMITYVDLDVSMRLLYFTVIFYNTVTISLPIHSCHFYTNAMLSKFV